MTSLSDRQRLFADEFVFAPYTSARGAPLLDRTPAAAIFVGGPGDDTFAGGDENDSLTGGDGNDSFSGGGGDDTLRGDSDADTLRGDAGADSLSGGNGRDSLFGGTGNDTLFGDNDSDAMFGDEGNDTLHGGRGTDELNGGTGNDTLRGGEEADTMTGGEGRDVFVGIIEDFHGDVITDFGPGDRLETNATMRLSDLVFTDTLLQIRLDRDTNGVDEIVFNLLGDFRGRLIVFDDGGTDFYTVDRLPDLADHRAVPLAEINGMFTGPPQVRPGKTSVEIKLDDGRSDSWYNNTLGVYEVDDQGNMVNVRFLVQGTQTDPGATVSFDTPKTLTGTNNFGFFLIENGHNWVDNIGSSDTVSFIDLSDGSIANVADGNLVRIAVNGVASNIQVFHSYAPTLNRDGIDHVVSGVIESEGVMRYYVGFEDRFGGGDRDYQDVVIYSDDWF